MNSNVPAQRMDDVEIGFYIHSSNIFVDLEGGIGFSIDKNIAKVLLQKIADSEKGVQGCDATKLKRAKKTV